MSLGDLRIFNHFVLCSVKPSVFGLEGNLSPFREDLKLLTVIILYSLIESVKLCMSKDLLNDVP